MLSYQDRKSHCGDKTILRPSYLHNGITITGKTTSLYWIRAQVCNSGSTILRVRSNVTDTVAGANGVEASSSLGPLVRTGYVVDTRTLTGRSTRPWGVSLTFCELFKIFSPNLCSVEFQAETLSVCPKPRPRFRHKRKDSAWNSHHKYDFWHFAKLFWRALKMLVKHL